MSTLLVATLPMPLSINEMYPTDENGRRRLSWEGQNWRDEVFGYLDMKWREELYGQRETNKEPDFFRVHYINIAAINEIRELYAIKSKAKSVLERKKQYSLRTLSVFTSERRDVDGGHKILQDKIFDWIAGRMHGDSGVPFNDNRVIDVHMKRLVDKTVVEHIEVDMEECEIAWASGDLVTMAMQRVQRETSEQAFWHNTTERIHSIQTPDYETIRIPTVAQEQLRRDTIHLQDTQPQQKV